MNTTETPEDGWADLAKELGLESGSSSRSTPPPEPEDSDEDLVELTSSEEAGDPDLEPGEEVVLESAESGDSEELDDEGDADEETEGVGEGEPGEATPKKRRRRRRRRKKKGAGEANGESVAPVAASEEESEETLGESEEGWEDTSEYEEPGAVVGEEQVTPEAAREIVANWNVPSWEEIVAGLYRPER